MRLNLENCTLLYDDCEIVKEIITLILKNTVLLVYIFSSHKLSNEFDANIRAFIPMLII